ncbi:hypothetical protein OEB96_06055 [Paraliomyxa miuraensis]|nr:hypothetical protein [Paraliomyxa miuraensis]
MKSPSRIPKTRRPLALALGSLLAAGCSPEEEDFPLPDVVWEGTSVRVRMEDPSIEVCGGSFEGLDRHVELVREALLLEGDGVVEYSIGDEDFVDAGCDGSPLGCTKATSGNVFTSLPLHQHEIVHAVRALDPELEYRSSAFEEGLATLFGSDDLDNDIRPLEVMDILTASHVGGREEYFRAGHAMAILRDRHGAAAFRRFDVSSASMDEDQAFIEAFGESKEQFAAAAEGEPVCEQSQWWVPLLECEGEPIVADPATDDLVLRGDLSCAAEDVRGPRGGWMWTFRHFRLDRSTSTIDYQINMPEDAMLEIVGCYGGCPGRFAYIGGRYDVGSILNGLPTLEPGEYFLRMSRPTTEGAGDFEVVLQ